MAAEQHVGGVFGLGGVNPLLRDLLAPMQYRLHVHQLVAKIPRSRRWRVSRNGRRVMAAAVKLREVAYPSLYAEAA